MPVRPKSICRHPGCGTAISAPGYCEKHIDDARQWDNKRFARARQKRRALATNSSSWRLLREQVLREQPLCIICLEKGKFVQATVVDHVNGNAMDNSRSNLQSLCASCHSEKTAREDGGVGNVKKNQRGAGQKSEPLVSDSRPQSYFCVRKFHRGGI